MNLSSGRSRWRTDKAVCGAYAPTQPDASGDVSALLGCLAVARAKTNRTLDAVPPAAMTRPTPWVNWQIDVRFRLHRFASHLVEQTIQSEKILIALGWGQTRRPADRAAVTAAFAELEALGAQAVVRDLESRLVERFASV